MTANETNITVSRVIDAPTNEIFDVLTLPQRHNEFDGSEMVRSDEKSQRIQGTGDTFVMNMHNAAMGDYQMENHVHVFADNKLVGWQPKVVDAAEPGGWEWVYELEPLDSGSTEVTLSYDWSRVTDEKLLPSFPAVSEEQLGESLNRLAAAVAG